ncbi:TetR/AcrR family transcriptional regulator [Actinophytocola sp.]|uniref:TetR/AcrR family transcriptional regulator n=1 Tax=Actinophytocola sp. TaxID=1872138 RepID=UPI002ED54926
MTTARPPLRERKKRRTREALIDTALELFTSKGFAHTTLDELCDTVDVSKRTFFRNFVSKEDVAMAPTQDLWTAFLGELRVREPTGEPLLALLRDILLAAVDAMPDGWASRVVLSRKLAQTTPSMNAHGLDFCDRTTRAALEILRDRVDLADDLRPRLALDIGVAAFHVALERWVSGAGEPSHAALSAALRNAFEAVPTSLTLIATPRVSNTHDPRVQQNGPVSSTNPSRG